MPRQSKYIFGDINTNHGSVGGAIVFPDFCDHAQMAERNCVPGTVTSAGFVTVTTNVNGHPEVKLSVLRFFLSKSRNRTPTYIST